MWEVGNVLVFFFLEMQVISKISWTLLHGGADLAGTCLIFKGKPIFEYHLLVAKHCKSVHQCSQQCRATFSGLLTGPSWPGTQVATAPAAGGELQS